MAHETLECAEGVSSERLSALRDETLAPAETQRLREHVATCPACRARLADYDALAMALRQQRELEPGERIVSGVRARLAEQRAPRRWLRPSRRVWAGLATLAPVAAIILLFVYVFSGLAGRGRPATANTPNVGAPTAVPTNQFGKPVYPTATPVTVTLPPMTSSVSIADAWGAPSPVATFQTPKVANTQFTLNALSPDATTLAGTELAHADPGSGVQTVYLISYDIASHTYRRLGPHWSGYGGPWGGASAVSARFISYGFNSAPGATCGVCNNTSWAYDRQTGSSWEFDPGKQYGGDLADITSADHVAFTSIEQQVWVADFATSRVTLALPIDAQPINPTASSTSPQASIGLVGFVWPNLIYEYSPPQTNPNTPVATTLRISNLQTHVTTIIPAPLNTLFGAQDSGANIDWAYISGDMLYLTTYTQVTGVDTTGAPVNTGYGMLFRLSLSGSTSQPEMLARWLQPQYGQAAATGEIATHGGNDRLIVLSGGYVWDIAEGKLVRLATPGGAQAPVASLTGSYLMLTRTVSASDPQAPVTAGSIYNTAALPVR